MIESQDAHRVDHAGQRGESEQHRRQRPVTVVDQCVVQRLTDHWTPTRRLRKRQPLVHHNAKYTNTRLLLASPHQPGGGPVEWRLSGIDLKGHCSVVLGLGDQKRYIACNLCRRALFVDPQGPLGRAGRILLGLDVEQTTPARLNAIRADRDGTRQNFGRL